MKLVEVFTDGKNMKNRILTTCFIALSLQAMAQQPAGTYNVKTDGAAKGDGSANDTVAIRNALNASKAAGKNVYFPNGTYIVNAPIIFPSNIRIFGDKSGVSLIKAIGTYELARITDDGGTTGNLTIEDMFFLNVGFLFPKNNISNVTVARCVIAADVGGLGDMMYELGGEDMVVEDSIFLSGHHETGAWLRGRVKALRVEKAERMRISRNIFGLDLGNLSWLDTEWQGYANWSNAVGRLQKFREDQGLPRRMGEMAGAIAIFNGDSNVIDQNIIHLDFDANLAGGLAEDHLIYSIRETKIAITRNWLSGHPNTAGGGLKHRDTAGPGVIAANYLNDTPLLLYSYGYDSGGPYDHLDPFDNQLIFRNHLKVTPQRVLPESITGGSSRYGFNFMTTDSYRGRNIDVAENLFDLAPNIQNQGINLAQGRTTVAEWRIYESNFHVSGVNTGKLVEISGRNDTPGAYTYHTDRRKPTAPYLSGMNVDMAKYEAMEIPYLNIPPYGTDPVENNPPVFTSTPGAARLFNVGQAYTYNITATDADGQALAISAAVRPSWLTFTSTGNGTAILTGTAPNSAVVSYPVSLSVSDGITRRMQSFVITLNTAPAGNEPSGLLPPAITRQPAGDQTINAGADATLTVGVSSAAPAAYQWYKDGTPINGATQPSLVLPRVRPVDAGIYTVVVTNAAGSVASTAARLAVAFSRLINVSILAALATPGDTLTIGYVLGGAGTTGTTPLLVRAAGPSLATFGVGGTLADPRLELFAGSTKTGENDNWSGAPAVAGAMTAVGAFAFTGPTSRDAAAVLSVAGGNNSVRVSAADTGTGLVIAELYDATPSAGFNGLAPRLINTSVLKQVGTGFTAGFVLGGSGSRSVLIRAIGPTLGSAFGVAGVVSDPRLTLNSGPAAIAANDNWGGGTALGAAFTSVGAFALPAGSRDAAVVASLSPGSYTVQVDGVGGTSGLVLVEIYELP